MIIGANFMESIDCYRPAERPVKKENTKFVPKVQPEKDWTVLFYIDGNNNLSGMANHSFSSLKKVGTNKNVNIVAQLAIEDNDVRRGLVQKKDSDELFPESENLGKVNMGDPNTLRDFIISSLKYNPAKNVALVLWDHGAGFKGSMTDDKNKSLIDNKELANALKEAEKITGKKIDLINFNACLMQQTEVAYEIKNNANYLVGSEELEAGLRIPIPGIYGTTPQHKVMQDLVDGIKQKGRVTPEELAKLYVFESKNQIASSMFSPTQSALDLSKIDNVKKSADELAKAMIDKIKADPKAMNIIRDNISDTQKYIAQDLYAEPYVDFRDVGDFAKNLIKEKKFEGTEIQKKAAELLKNVDDAVIAEQHSTVSSAGKVLAGSTGLSIYLPKDFGFDNKGNNPIDNVPAGGTHGYENSTFAKDTN